MIKIKKEELLKDAPDYEDYSENVCILSMEELKEAGLLQCGGCCSKNKESSSGKCKGKCSGCRCKK